MPEYRYTFRRDDESIVRYIEPTGSPIVCGGREEALAKATRLVAELAQPLTIVRTRASRPYMGDGEAFDSPAARKVRRLVP